MWFFGFSSPNLKNLWTIGAIILVILFIIIITKWAICLGSDQQGEGDITALTHQGKVNCSKNKNGCCHCSSAVGVTRTYALEELKVATRDFRVESGRLCTYTWRSLGTGDSARWRGWWKREEGARRSFFTRFLFYLGYLILIWWGCWDSAWRMVRHTSS